MKILIKFPTRGRPEKFFEVLDKYYSFLSDIDKTIFQITFDEDDTLMNNNNVIDKLKNYKNLFYNIGISKTKIHAVNRDIIVGDWDILLLASDDMIPIKNGYDDIIRKYMIDKYPDTDGILWFNDGHQGKKLNTLCILGKKYYDRFGYIYNPKYISVWSDNEFMDVGNILEKQTYLDEVIIQHQHPDWGFGKRDVIHTNNLVNESKDRQTYIRRKEKNFEL
jgi:hypothetical protein